LNPTATASGTGRLDKWLWAVRIFRTRSLASDACRAGSVAINDQPAKPARAVRPGETIAVRQGLVRRTLLVVGVPRSRVGPKLVATYCTDLTPEAEWEAARQHRVQQLLAREKGSGRPTKRDRRLLDRLLA
jgi:ribosome-associated heat shock protein Hsp15